MPTAIRSAISSSRRWRIGRVNAFEMSILVARLGGDEFAIMQAGASQPTDADRRWRRDSPDRRPVLEESRSRSTEHAPDLAGTGSIRHRLRENADMALYRAKSDGHGLYRFFEPEMDARMQAPPEISRSILRKAIANGEFELFYQPLVDMKTEYVTGFEALIRWQPSRARHDPRRSISSQSRKRPGSSCPWETGCCVKPARKPRLGRAMWNIVVNLSPVQFKNKILLPSVVSALTASGSSPNRLELEITESWLLLQDSGADTLPSCTSYESLGVRISMDDFGTGYSSLSHLRKFPFDKIKIDQSFISDMSNHDDSLAIVRAVIAMGSGLGIATTAEGVEYGRAIQAIEIGRMHRAAPGLSL